MKIAQVIHSLGIGGAEKQLVTFANAARTRDVQLSVITLFEARPGPFLSELEALGVTFHNIASRKVSDPIRFARLVRLLQREQFDVVQTHLESANILGVMAGRVTGTPVVATLHLASRESTAWYRLTMETLAIRYAASQVVAVGPRVAEAHAQYLKRSIRVIRNPVPYMDRIEQAERDAARYELIGTNERTILISVGRLVPNKGYLDLIEAFREVHRALPSTGLAIVGDGAMRDVMETRIAEDGLRDSVFLLGERSDIPRLLGAADVYVNASHMEGMSLSILEAMAAGLPIVATAVGDTTTLIRRDTGVLVPPHNPKALADTLCTLLTDPKRAGMLAERAQAYVIQTHDPANWLDQVLALYAEIARPARTARVRREIHA